MDSKTERCLRRRAFLSQLIAWGSASGMMLSSIGCGTILHKERINRPHSHDLDWKIVALNGLGLILFFIPGVIAFVVDFHTGAIYLPAHPMAMKPALEPGATTSEPAALLDTESTADQSDLEQSDLDPTALTKIEVTSSELNLATIEREVTNHVGTPVSLSDSSSRVTELKHLDEYATARQRHEADRAFGISPKRFFQRFMRSRSEQPSE